MEPVSLRPFLAFDAEVDEPSASEEIPAGRELAERLVDGVARRGVRVLAPVEMHESFGWSFVLAEEGRQRVHCLLQCPDSWLLITRLEIPLSARLFGEAIDHETHRRVCEALHAAALEQPGVSNVRWFTKRDYQEGGVAADRP